MSFAMIELESGRVLTLHRLALAVRPIDAATGGPAGSGLRAGRETVRSIDRVLRTPRHPGRTGQPSAYPANALPGRYAAGFVLRHRLHDSATAVIRLDDPAHQWVPRRLTVPLWTLGEVEASDPIIDATTGAVIPPHGPFVPATSRTVTPWLLPGAAYQPPPTTTGLRVRVLRGGIPVRWPRIEAFSTAGRLGWGHGDEHGEVLLLATERTVFPPPGTTQLQVVLRVHSPDPQVEPGPEAKALLAAGDRLGDLPIEPFVKTPINPAPGPVSDLVSGITPPGGYVAAPDVVVILHVGRVSRLDALVLPT